MRLTLAVTLLLVTPLVTAPGPADTVWPQFRGPAGRATSPIDTLPTSWSTTMNVAWKADLQGRGWSSPIVWGDQVFVTTAVSPGASKQPSPGIYGNDYAADLLKSGASEAEMMEKLLARDVELPKESGDLRFLVYSFDVATGRIRWEREAYKGPPGGRHRKNTYASETPATDGERVYVLFGNIGLFCYSMDGALLWTHRIDPQPRYLFAVKPGAAGDISLKTGETSNDFVAWYQPRAGAYTSSPLAFGGRVYVVNDNGVLQVFDARTGHEIYKVRVGGVGNTFSASPWTCGGLVFFLSEEGDTFVVKPGDAYEEVAKNSLGELALASPAVTRDGLFIRTQTRLYRIR